MPEGARAAFHFLRRSTPRFDEGRSAAMRIATAAGLAGMVLACILAGARGADTDFTTIFDGSTSAGWITNKGQPLPRQNVQADGLNPHASRGYIVVHQK